MSKGTPLLVNINKLNNMVIPSKGTPLLVNINNLNKVNEIWNKFTF